MFFDSAQIPSLATIMSVAASAAATFMLVQSFARHYLPHEVSAFIDVKLKNLIARFCNELTLLIEEYDDGLNQNKLFKAAKLYLEPKIPPYVKRIKLNLAKKETNVSLSLEKNEEIVDVFNGVQLKWKFESKPDPEREVHNNQNYLVKSNITFFALRFHKKHKDTVLRTYIPHILKKSKELSKKKKTLKLFTLFPYRGDTEIWQSVNLDHPATFDTLAMDFDMKKMIMDDLERFLKRKEFYKRVGKAWKRGYLLYGPPGTGKSSLIAAMANYLNFDDIDCCLEMQDRLAKAKAAIPDLYRSACNQGNRVTLSGLLNFIDGLWSSCGDERIIIFTTNHKDRLDPALLRPGRMDVHIHMSYCTPCGFKMLASNYLGITEHPLFLEVEELIEKVEVTPADVAEQLMRDEVPKIALSGLIQFLQIKKRETGESKATEAEETVRGAENIQELSEKTDEVKTQ
ncbi:protein HYPER-SENSITIVITY-RELATED 4 [Citrus sinensis]|uniref:Protein HYPER-SENSITIVITY-RELATED 4 n=1 Tax=Citrus sinensis TaxID=2711 RepID=A0ACB8IGW5_CITSI|nr:protein HYPER-SENSITIVITY-RELATED 4 [Citrus sinensis]